MVTRHRKRRHEKNNRKVAEMKEERKEIIGTNRHGK